MFLRSPLIRSPLTVVFLQTPPSLRATSPNLGEESGRMTNGNVKTENVKGEAKS